jgi:hypothetical protein
VEKREGWREGWRERRLGGEERGVERGIIPIPHAPPYSPYPSPFTILPSISLPLNNSSLHIPIPQPSSFIPPHPHHPSHNIPRSSQFFPPPSSFIPPHPHNSPLHVHISEIVNLAIGESAPPPESVKSAVPGPNSAGVSAVSGCAGAIIGEIEGWGELWNLGADGE